MVNVIMKFLILTAVHWDIPIEGLFPISEPLWGSNDQVREREDIQDEINGYERSGEGEGNGEIEACYFTSRMSSLFHSVG